MSSAKEIAANAQEDLEDDYSSAAVPEPKNPDGWQRRSRCDECREKLGFMGQNLAVPAGTPILCGPCSFKPEVRKKWKS